MELLVFLLLISLTVSIGHCASSPINGSVRLVDGDIESEGRVEVYINGEWGTVCDDGWDIADGNVVCAQLEYTNASQVALNAFYGKGSGPIHFFGLDCIGNETNLTQCPTYQRKNCLHSHDAGVECYPPAKDSGGGLSPTLIGVIILVPFLILIVLITVAICVMIYLTMNYDRTAFEEQENQRRIRRFTHGLSLKEQSMLATKGRKGIFRSIRRGSDLPNMSGSSSFVERSNIPRGALGEGLPHPWQTEEVETDIDDDENFTVNDERPSKVRRTVEAFNPAAMSTNVEDSKDSKQSSVPVRYRKGRTEESDDDSDFNPYEDKPNIHY